MYKPKFLGEYTIEEWKGFSEETRNRLWNEYAKRTTEWVLDFNSRVAKASENAKKVQLHFGLEKAVV